MNTLSTLPVVDNAVDIVTVSARLNNNPSYSSLRSPGNGEKLKRSGPIQRANEQGEAHFSFKDY